MQMVDKISQVVEKKVQYLTFPEESVDMFRHKNFEIWSENVHFAAIGRGCHTKH